VGGNELRTEIDNDGGLSTRGACSKCRLSMKNGCGHSLQKSHSSSHRLLAHINVKSLNQMGDHLDDGDKAWWPLCAYLKNVEYILEYWSLIKYLSASYSLLSARESNRMVDSRSKAKRMSQPLYARLYRL